MAGSALFAAISGLRSHQTFLDVTANNVANINTFGFKSSRLTFADLLAQTIRAASSPEGERGGVNPMQVGLGVQVGSIDNIMTQGSIQSTGNVTDLAINGDGFFVVEGNQGEVYTRAGNFQIDALGRLVTVSGGRVQGYTGTNAEGTQIERTGGLTDIVINFGEKIPARATELVNYRSNLDASSDTFGTAELVSAGSTGFTLAAGIASPLASFTGGIVASGIPPFVIPDALAGGGDLVLNGEEMVIDFSGNGFTDFSDPVVTAQFIADAINEQSSNIYARVLEDGQLELESLFGGGLDLIIGGNAPFLNDLGLVAGTYVEPEPSSALAGIYTIAVQEATAAEGTTQRPVPAGTLVAETITINDVVISYGPTPPSNTSVDNAQLIADAINAFTSDPGTPTHVEAEVNLNGTLTLRSVLPGLANVIAVEDPGASGATGLDTLGTFTTNPFGPPASAFVVDNGADAFVEAEFESADGTIVRTRRFTDESVFGVASALSSLEPLILGANPSLPLIPGVTLTAEQLRSGQARIETADAFSHTATAGIFDSAGIRHELVIEFKHFSENLWRWEATLPAEPNLVLANNLGFIEFGESGLVRSTNPADLVTFQPLGAELVEIQLVFDGDGDTIDGVTQFAGASTTAANFQDGYPLGVLQSFAFDINGNVQGQYSNGLTRPIAQLGLANFNNPAGLQRIGQNLWASTANSGTVQINTPGTGGAGIIFPGALEQSNVDLSTEFTNLIIGQRGFQANTRVITTQDEILGEVVNLVR